MKRQQRENLRHKANRLGVGIIMCVFLAMTAFADEQFLDPEELALLQPFADVPGVMRYQVGNNLPANFDRLLIGSVTFFFAEDSKSKDIDPDELKKISDALRGAIADAAKAHWEIVDEPGPGVLQINVGVSNIKMRNKKRGLLGYTPIGLVATTAGNLAGLRVTLAGADLQGETLDSVSGAQVTFFAIESIGEYDDKKGMSWEDVRATLNDFAARVAQTGAPVQ